MKVAIVHDYIKEYGGAERVLEALHELYPNAPIFTLVYLPSFLGPHRERFKRWDIRTSFLQFIPFRSKLISPLRIVAPMLFKTFDFSKFDVVIVSQTGAYVPNSINKNGAIQICYTHTPPRYLYGFATAREWKKNSITRVLGELMNHFLRLVDFRSSKNVDYFIANSKNVAKRIQKFYRKDAKIIYPPVDNGISNFKLQISNSRNYFLAGGRIARPKNIELIVKTFERLKLPLKVFGREFGGLSISISLPAQAGKYPNISFLGEVSDEKKYQLMRDAKAFVFASEDEDFGITPVEAMAVGTPVLAYRSGGVLESVIDPSTARSGQVATGIFFDELTVKSLKNAVFRFNKIRFDTTQIIKHASKFSKEKFKKEIENFVRSRYARTSRS